MMGQSGLRWKPILFFFVFAVLLAGLCQAGTREVIRINGSGSALVLAKSLAEVYMKSHPHVRIEVEKALGSSGAIKALQAGALELVASSRRLKPQETANGLVAHFYGKTPLLIVTEKRIRKRNITTAELEDIFSGKIRRWPNGEAIRVVLRPEADIDTTILRGLSPGMNRAITMAHARPGMIVAVTDPDSNDIVAKTPGAIGASGLTGVLYAKGSLNALRLNGVKATPEKLAKGEYPLVKDILFVTKPGVSAHVREFLAFINSPAGRAIAEKTGVLVIPAQKRFK